MNLGTRCMVYNGLGTGQGCVNAEVCLTAHTAIAVADGVGVTGP